MNEYSLTDISFEKNLKIIQLQMGAKSEDWFDDNLNVNNNKLMNIQESYSNQFQPIIKKEKLRRRATQNLVRKIEVDYTNRIILRRDRIKKGEERETNNLNKFVFNDLKRHFHLLSTTHQLNNKQIAAWRVFLSRKGIISSYSPLFAHQIFKQRGKSYVESSLLVKNILGSMRMNSKKKVMTLKFLQTIRRLCFKPLTSWKGHSN